MVNKMYNKQLSQGPESKDKFAQSAQLEGKTGVGQKKYCVFSRCLNVSRDCEEVMCEGKLFHICTYTLMQFTYSTTSGFCLPGLFLELK